MRATHSLGSAVEALQGFALAQPEPDKEVVFFAIVLATTTSRTAVAMLTCQKIGA